MRSTGLMTCLRAELTLGLIDPVERELRDQPVKRKKTVAPVVD
jgi:hypothetical protein